MTSSIIVPVYHGKEYIPALISQAEANAESGPGRIELVLVNDAPEEPIGQEWTSDTVRILVINSEINRGIHGARVKGLENAEGEFVVFLDQDDRIAVDYIKKQLAAIHTADAAVCNAVQVGTKLYRPGRTLKTCIQKEYMIRKENGIVSPGQVLLRKEAIPAFWKNHLLEKNGADDWFLWLCMLCGGKTFACNDEVLFEHVIHTNNASGSGFSMVNSLREVCEKMKENLDCTREECEAIGKVVREQEDRYVRERDKFLAAYFLLDDWLTIREQGKSIAGYLCRRGHKRVAVYGKGRIGKRLAKELKAGGIKVDCFIDRNAGALPGSIESVLPEEFTDVNELVILTLVKEEAEEAKRALKNRGIRQIYLFSEIIGDLKHGTCERNQTG